MGTKVLQRHWLKISAVCRDLRLPIWQLVTPSLGKQTNAMRHTGRVSQMKREVSKGVTKKQCFLQQDASSCQHVTFAVVSI